MRQEEVANSIKESLLSQKGKEAMRKPKSKDREGWKLTFSGVSDYLLKGSRAIALWVSNKTDTEMVKISEKV